MKNNRPPLKTGKLKQLERENSIFNVNTVLGSWYTEVVEYSSSMWKYDTQKSAKIPQMSQGRAVWGQRLLTARPTLSFSDIKVHYWERTCLDSNLCSYVWEARKEERGRNEIWEGIRHSWSKSSSPSHSGKWNDTKLWHYLEDPKGEHVATPIIGHWLQGVYLFPWPRYLRSWAFLESVLSLKGWTWSTWKAFITLPQSSEFALDKRT